MKLLLYGKDGQVGRELQRTLAPLGELVALGRAQADFNDMPALRETLHTHAPAIIVNAAAYTAVDRAETDEAAAFRINAAAVDCLAHYAHATGALLVHYSTDYVYDGAKTTPYVETDAPSPRSVYGRSKLAGEQAIARAHCTALVLRTSWVISAHGHNFIKTMLRLASERDELRVVADQHGAPTSAALIADTTARAIVALRAGRLPTGTYHLAAAGETTWHELACRVIERARANGMPLKLDASRIRAITTSEYGAAAHRPQNSRLDTRALAGYLGLDFPDWRVGVDEVVDELTGGGLDHD